MKNNSGSIYRSSSAIIAFFIIFFANYAQAALSPFQSFVGNVGLSTDGFGSTTESGIISASVPAGSTVLAAYLYSATNTSSTIPTVQLDGTSVTFGPAVPNATACCNLRSYRSDVTSIVKSSIESGPGGIYDFSVTESGLFTNQIDGEALVIVYENAALPNASVGLLDGFASVTGDSTSINFASPLAPTSAGFFAEMSLGISFSCCSQRSTVNVNGQLLTDNAGNNDDSSDPSLSNGNLITVGGFEDSIFSSNPSYSDDSEYYDLTTFIDDGDTSIVVDTVNASQDDNIFFAGFYVSGEAGFNAPPPNSTTVSTPPVIALFGVSMCMFLRRGRKEK
ncbi:hypothetical protein KL866_03545 [Alteromonas sp. ALT199]|uniref:hypothetical protein n=1 Tax=unclassified Alteromonas TaxID=2614992 RepID=UPI00044DE6CD|nr:hypothetical protein [Alteromonas sp. ALT199]MBT3134189.1 hypothetical protein [Alteromonas sp. ALT199]